ncbi:hypothetical protein IV203_028658 [Nitzschia inconspicua]|uniref:Uncharacterized protein n=1 Tax=Nitzschia inconspicua TaxID=303405 RepID=A0A9K3LQ90_9STRA|nr:hypothetical protein IV203_028658 [Nitzschia inconspicua]
MVREMLPSRSCCPLAVWTFAIRIRAVRTIASLRAVHDTCPDDALSTSRFARFGGSMRPRKLQRWDRDECRGDVEEHHDHSTSDAITDVTNSSVITMAHLHLVVAFGLVVVGM